MKQSLRRAALALLAGGALNAHAAGSSLPIERYLEVSPGVYRGGRPGEGGLEVLRSSGVRTVINLEDDRKAVAQDQAMANEAGMGFLSVPMNAWKKPTDAAIDGVLNVMADPAQQPVFLHCHQGRDRTGLMVGLYRVLVEGVDPAVAYKEMIARGYRTYFTGMRKAFEARTGYRTRSETSETLGGVSLFDRLD